MQSCRFCISRWNLLRETKSHAFAATTHPCGFIMNAMRPAISSSSSRPVHSAAKQICALIVFAFPLLGHAAQDHLEMGGDIDDLPSLPGDQRAERATPVKVDAGTIALRERSFDDVLGVRLDGYRALAPAVVLEKGWLMNEELGIGGAASLRSGVSELLLNSVYAPRKDVRVLFSVSQLRADRIATYSAGNAATVMQTAYVSSVNKQWSKSRYLPEAGLAVFSARADGIDRQSMLAEGLQTGSMAGYMLKLAARPMARTRIEVSYQTQDILYGFNAAELSRDLQASASVNYAQSFDDCSQLLGRYTAGPGMSEADLRYQWGAFNVGVLQTRSNTYSNTALRMGYSIPLGRVASKPTNCAAAPANASPFGAVVDNATARSPYLPKAPLTRTVAPEDFRG
jgi:hypothetical protein